jgi:hypothetical protein
LLLLMGVVLVVAAASSLCGTGVVDLDIGDHVAVIVQE